MTWVQSFRIAGRLARRAPVLAVAVSGLLAIGIGANAGMAAVVDALLFRPPLNVDDATRLVRLLPVTHDPLFGTQTGTRFSYPTFLELERSGAFSGLGAAGFATVSVGTGSSAADARAMLVTHAFFQVLGSHARLGTLKLDGNKVVLAYGFWNRQFGGDPAILGAVLNVGGADYRVAGIAPAGFVALSRAPVDIWLPIEAASRVENLSKNWRNSPGFLWLDIVARIPPGSVAEVAAERASFLLRQQRGKTGNADGASAITTASVLYARASNGPREARVALWLAGLALCVLVITCVNVATLFLAYASTRTADYATRIALGASQGKLIQEVAAELAVLALPGLLLAWVLDVLIRRIVPRFLSSDVPLAPDVFDPRTAGLAALSSIVALILILAVCSIPLRRLIAAGPVKGISSSDRPVMGRRLRQVALAGQAALALPLLWCAGLFAESLQRVEALDLGVRLRWTVQASFNLPRASRTDADVRMLYDEALARIRQVPGVEFAAISEANPYMSGRAADIRTAEQSQNLRWSDRPAPWITAVGPGFFTTVGATTLRGRDFTADDRAGSEPVLIITAPLAHYLWPAEDALGKCVLVDSDRGCVRVVGVLGAVWKMSIFKRNTMIAYAPLSQTRSVAPGAILARVRSQGESILSELRRTLQEVEPNLPAITLHRAIDIAAPEYRPWQLGASFFSALGGIAALLSAVGLYAIVAFTTAARRREIAIRIALGASWRHVARIVTADGILATGAGLLSGLGVILPLAPKLQDVMFQTSPREPQVLVLAVTILLGCATVATLGPAIRAMRLPPAESLRSE